MHFRLFENFFIAVLVLLSHLLYSRHLGHVSIGGEMTFLRENVVGIDLLPRFLSSEWTNTQVLTIY